MGVGKIMLSVLLVFFLAGSVAFLISAMFTADYRNNNFVDTADELFERYDFNMDGVIDFEEYNIVVKDCYVHGMPTSERIQFLFNAIDSNENNVIDRFEINYNDLANLNEAHLGYTGMFK